MSQELSYVLQLMQFSGPIILVTIYVVLIRARADIVDIKLQAVNDRLDTLATAFSTLAEMKTDMTINNMQILSLKQDLDNLRKGRGWMAEELNGEYTTTRKVERK